METAQAIVVVEPSDSVVHGHASAQMHLRLVVAELWRQDGVECVIGLEDLALGQLNSEDALLVLLAHFVNEAL